MFAYCLNNPVDAVDPNGNFAIPIIGLGLLWLLTMIAAAAGAVVSPAPSFKWPNSSLKPQTNSGSYSNSKPAATPKPKTDPKAKANDVVRPMPRPRPQPIFPANPQNFTPRGLTVNYLSGSKNGAFYKWSPGGDMKAYVFRWDENPNGPAKDGSHYHIAGVVDDKNNLVHFYLGTPVPEPWASLYF